MRTLSLALSLVLGFSLLPGAQSRGWISNLTATTDANPGTVQFTLRGTNPCSAISMDYGDGIAITHPIRELPVRIPHEYQKAGTYIVRAMGIGNCDGDYTTSVNVASVRPGQDEPLFDWTDEQFRQLDRNRDNVIARGEWGRDPAEFQRVDRNGDDRLSRAEFLDGGAVDRGQQGRGRGNRDQSVTVTVSGRDGWMDTGIDVREGDEVEIVANGRIQYGPRAGDTAGPTGATGYRAPARAPLPRLPIGTLIARVGNSAPFSAVTTGERIQEPVGGRLFLGINDDNLRDNSGEFRVTVTIMDASGNRGRGRGRGGW